MSRKAAARVGDPISHGGTLTSGSRDVKVNGRQATIAGESTISCSLHGSGLLSTGSSSVKINGKPAGRLGETCSCSATVVAACSTDVNIGGSASTRVGPVGPDLPPWAVSALEAMRLAGSMLTMPNAPGAAAAAVAAARAAADARATAAAARDDPAAIAARLVRPGGSATQADADAVAAELARMPLPALQTLEANGTRVVAARDSVADGVPELRGVQPRGWPPGSGWEQVRGAYLPDRNEVVVATVGDGTANGRRVPATGDGHGSANLVVHEAAHAIDARAGPARNSASPAFTRARAADLAAITDYERQPGAGGPSETYAESAARYYGGARGRTPTPNLDAYWRDNPLGGR